MKVDLKRERRELYAPRRTPHLVDVPPALFLVVDGRGDPSGDAWPEAVSALYSVAYAARFALKRSGVLDYGVMPLEALWWADDWSAFPSDDRSAWQWTAMVLQPPEVTSAVLEQARAVTAAKRPSPVLDRLRLEVFAEGRAAQVLHVGPYREEGPTIAALHAFVAEQGLSLSGRHHEVYLGDPRRAAPERLRTVLRQPVAGTGTPSPGRAAAPA